MADIFKDKTQERADRPQMAVMTRQAAYDRSEDLPLPGQRRNPDMEVRNVQRPRFGRDMS